MVSNLISICLLTRLVTVPCSWLFLKDKNIRTEPKHVVFLSHLLMLFKFCHLCKADNPLVEAKEVGTEVVVNTSCGTCKKESTWHSQPTMPGSSTPAGNFLFCMAILLAGGSASKVLQIFSHMGLGCISLKTFKYQRVSTNVEIPKGVVLDKSIPGCSLGIGDRRILRQLRGILRLN